MKWTNGRVPYVFKPDISAPEQLVFKRSVRAWQRFANLRFVPTTENLIHQSPDGDYLLVQRNDLQFLDWVKDVNYAWIGRSGASGYPFTGMQPMSIHNWTGDIVVHELGHTLGFIHEQMRPDRNSFVKLNWDQINGFTAINFDIEPNAILRTDYDYDSVMHYASTAFRDTWKTGSTMEAIADPDKTPTMGRNLQYPPHPEELDQGPIGKITALLSDGDRMAIGAEYGKPTNVKGVVKVVNGKRLKNVTAVLSADGSSNDEQAFIDLITATGERTVKTDKNGEFFFRGVPTGNFKITISKAGYSFDASTSTFVGGSTESLTHNFVASNTETTPPSSSITTPANNGFYKTLPDILGEASDTGGAGLKQIELALDSSSAWWHWTNQSFGTPGAAFAANINAHPHTVFADDKWAIPASIWTNLPDGTHHLQVRATDFSDNVDEWEGVTFTIDRSSPTVTVDTPAGGNVFFDFETLPLGGAITDATDPEPIVTFTIRENNGATGNKYWTGSGWVDNDSDPRTALRAKVSGGRWEPLSVASLPPRSELRQGPFIVTVKAADRAGNNALSASLHVTRSPVDTTIPDIAFFPSFDGDRYSEHAMPALTGVAIDDESGVQGVRLYFMRLVPKEEGGNDFKYWNGEEWSDTPGHLEVDYNKETHDWSAPALDYALPGAADLPDGTYKVQATAFNRESPQGTRLVENTFHIATAPPQIAVTSPPHNGFVKAGWSIHGTVTDPSGTGFENNRVSFTLFKDGKYWTGSEWEDSQIVLHAPIVAGAWTYPGDDPEASLPEGETQYVLSAFVKDRNGNISLPVAGGQPGNNQIIFRIDTTPPELVIASPTAGATFTTSTIDSSIFNGTASDASGRPGVSLFLKRLVDDYFWSGTSWQSAENAILPGIYVGGEQSETWELQKEFPCLNKFWWGMPNGDYELIAVARDSAGNQTQKSSSIVVDYRPVWLRPQDLLAEKLPVQTPPIANGSVDYSTTQSFSPWLADTPGYGGNINPCSFTADSQGRFFVVNSAIEQFQDRSRYHGVIQRLGEDAWRRQRLIHSEVSDGITTFYKRWSPEQQASPIGNIEALPDYAAPAAAKTDSAGNTYVAYNTVTYSYFSDPKSSYWINIIVVKFNANGDVVWQTMLPYTDLENYPQGWLERSLVQSMDVFPDGSVNVLLNNITSYSWNNSVTYYRNLAVAIRLNAAGAWVGTTRMGQMDDYDSGVPYISSNAVRSAADANGNAFVMTTEGTEGESYTSQVLRKIGPNGAVLATYETNLCKAPEYWYDLKTDAEGNVYVLSNFDLSLSSYTPEGRACVTKFDNSLNLQWRAFGPPDSLNLSGSIQDSQNYLFHVGGQGITVAQSTPGSFSSGHHYEHPLVMRFSLTGDLLWAREIASPNNAGRDGITQMEVTSTGDVLFLGWFTKEGITGESIYGKLSNAGDIQFTTPITLPGSVFGTTLLPDQRLAALTYTFSLYSPDGIQKVLVFDNPSNQLIPIALESTLPQSRNATTGDTVEFTVVNRGSAATYQWYKEDTGGVAQPIPGATGDTLRLENIALTDAGRYSCTATNALGSATSRTATLTVVAPVALDVALDTSGRVWTTSEEAPWTGFMPSPTHDGTDAAASGTVADSGASWVETVVTGPATVSFWWKLSADYFDDFTFSVDGVVTNTIYGDQNWLLVNATLGAGTHTLRWTFEPYISDPSGVKKAYLDQFVVTTPIDLPTALDNTDLTFTTGGNAPWSGASGNSHDGIDVATSGDISDNQESWLETTFTGPGTLTFWWRTSSEGSFDFLHLIEDGAIARSVSGESLWTQVTRTYGAGQHTVRWSYEKDYIASYGADTAYVDEVIFTPGAPEPRAPTFAVQPQSQIGLVGGIVTLMPQVEGDPEPTYQWMKSTRNTVINGATYPFFGFGNAKTTDVNVYTVKATNSAGSATSEPAYIALAARGPAEVNLKEGGVLSLTATATVPAGCTISHYQWRRNSANLTDGKTGGITIAGAKTKALKITGMTTGMSGAYTCYMVMKTPGASLPGGTNGNTIVNVLQKPVITPPDLATYKVAQQVVNMKATATNHATKFIITGLPPGVKYNASTGDLYGAPTAASKVVKGTAQPYQVKFSASNVAGTSAVVTLPWLIDALDARAVGSFNGIVARNSALNGLPNKTTGLGGTIKLDPASTGIVSGTLKLGAQAPYKLTGSLKNPPNGGNPSYSLVIDRKSPAEDLTLELTIDLETGALAGNVTEAGTAATAAISGWRAAPTVDFNGRYHVGLILDPSLVNNAEYPQGTGYAAITVTGKGTVAWAGKLADGTAFTGGCPMGPAGQTALHSLLYASTGSVQGQIVINPATKNVDGAPGLSWFKPSQAALKTARVFKAGIPLHDLSLVGGPYVAKNVNLANYLGLGATLPNAKVTFSQGGLAATESRPLNINATTNAVTVPANDIKLTTAIPAGTGLITGSFRQPGITATTWRTANYYGLVIPRLTKGVGFFLLPELHNPPATTATTSPIWSGKVEVTAP